MMAVDTGFGLGTHFLYSQELYKQSSLMILEDPIVSMIAQLIQELKKVLD